MRRARMAGPVLIALDVVVAAVTGQAQGRPGVSERLYSAMRWRLIGPFRGGRVLAVSGVANRGRVEVTTDNSYILRSRDGRRDHHVIPRSGHLSIGGHAAAVVSKATK